MQQHNVGFSPSSSCTMSNDITTDVDVEDDAATSTNAGHHSPNDEPEQQLPHPEIPIEYQTYECDDVTKSQIMDPLEYTFPPRQTCHDGSNFGIIQSITLAKG
jgi:hypothetical protein